MESSGAEFLPILTLKKVKKPSRGSADREYKGVVRGPILRSRKPRRVPGKYSFGSDSDGSLPQPRSFDVEDILVEARDKHGRAMYLCLWSGFGPDEASWVPDTALNPALRRWWLLEREQRYPMYRDCDFVSYELVCVVDGKEMLDHQEAEVIGVVSDSKKDAIPWNPPLEEKKSGLYSRGTPLRVVDSQGRSKVILFSSSSSGSDVEGLVSPLQYRGETAYIVKEILDDRLYGNNKEYLILWDGYETPTWVPAENVNKVAVDVYVRGQRLKRKRTG